MGKAPKAPDPYAVSAAQTQSNQQTAAYNAALNRVSQYTPYGNLVYSQTGRDASGAPQYRADVSLTPETAHQLHTQQAQDSAIADLGLGLTSQIGSQINAPLPDGAASNEAARNAYYAKQTAFLDPQWNIAQDNADSKLSNQGVIQGSEAWNRAQDALARQKEFSYGQARNDAILQGQTAQQQALANALTQRNLPVNQLNALRSATQIQNPTFTNVPSANSANTDVSGNVWNSYNAQVANSNNFMNGLFGLGGAAITAFSDRRLKTAIKRIGKTRVMGLPLYAFRYIWGGPVRVGVMAQDVLRVKPEAVVKVGGYFAVNYGALA